MTQKVQALEVSCQTTAQKIPNVKWCTLKNIVNLFRIFNMAFFSHFKQAGWDKSPSSKYLHVPPGLTYEHEGGFQWHARRPSID